MPPKAKVPAGFDASKTGLSGSGHASPPASLPPVAKPIVSTSAKVAEDANKDRPFLKADNRQFAVGCIYERDHGGVRTRALCTEIRYRSSGPATVCLGMTVNFSEKTSEAAQWILVGEVQQIELDDTAAPRYAEAKAGPNPVDALLRTLR